MTRLTAAVVELAAAIREEIAAELAAERAGPERLLSVREAAAAAGLGRTTMYQLVMAGKVRSIRPGGHRRRLIPASAINDLANETEAAAVVERHRGGKEPTSDRRRQPAA